MADDGDDNGGGADADKDEDVGGVADRTAGRRLSRRSRGGAAGVTSSLRTCAGCIGDDDDNDDDDEEEEHGNDEGHGNDDG